MSLILLLSIVLRLAAVIGALATWSRIRDWRIVFFTVMLVLMALRQILTLFSERTANVIMWGGPDEIPGLIVSVMALLAVFFLGRMLLQHQHVNTELRASEEKFASAFRTSPDAIAISSLETSRLFDVNEGFCQITGCSREEVLGKKWQDLGFWPEEDQREAFISALQNQGRVRNHEMHFRRGPGEARQLLLSAEPLTMDGRPHLLVVGRDITERRRVENAAREAQEKLLVQKEREKERVEEELGRTRRRLIRQTRLATIGQVAGSIAHELRTPLSVIRHAVYYLGRHVGADAEAYHEYLNMIDSEVQKANRIIASLLADVQANDPVKEPVDVHTLVEGVFRTIPDRDGVTLRCTFSDDPYRIMADAGQLRQVFTNLMTNAVQAMRSEGTLTVSGQRTDRCDVLVVRDTGPGISTDVREDVFEPLVTTRLTGTGLGLSICKEIVERHGGTISVEDGTGEGAAFRLAFPRLGVEAWEGDIHQEGRS